MFVLRVLSGDSFTKVSTLRKFSHSSSRHLSPTSNILLCVFDFCYRWAPLLGLHRCIRWLLLQDKNLKNLSSITQKSMYRFIQPILVGHLGKLSSIWEVGQMGNWWALFQMGWFWGPQRWNNIYQGKYFHTIIFLQRSIGIDSIFCARSEKLHDKRYRRGKIFGHKLHLKKSRTVIVSTS